MALALVLVIGAGLMVKSLLRLEHQATGFQSEGLLTFDLNLPTSVLTSVFALVAALLASVGVYSLIAYSVAQRTREIGIRVALGADRGSVVRLVVGEGLMLAAIGIVLGVAGSLLVTRFIQTLLYEVKPTDPTVLLATCGAVLVVAIVASLVPALRVDPMVALRAE